MKKQGIWMEACPVAGDGKSIGRKKRRYVSCGLMAALMVLVGIGEAAEWTPGNRNVQVNSGQELVFSSGGDIDSLVNEGKTTVEPFVWLGITENFENNGTFIVNGRGQIGSGAQVSGDGTIEVQNALPREESVNHIMI